MLRRKHNFFFKKNGYNKKYNKQKKNPGGKRTQIPERPENQDYWIARRNNSRSRHHVACRFVNFWKVIPEYNKCSNELDRTLLIVDEDNIENKKLAYYTPR